MINTGKPKVKIKSATANKLSSVILCPGDMFYPNT